MENKINPTNRRLKPAKGAELAPTPTQGRLKAKRHPTPQKSVAKPPKRVVRKRRNPLPWKKAIANVLALATLWGGAGLMGAGAWLSYELIVDPNASLWINQFLPKWSRLPFASGKTIYTLAQIQKSLRQVGLIAGDTIPLPLDKTADPTTSQLLIPILVERQPSTSVACKSPCQQLVELRVYQPVQIPYQRSETDQYYRQVASLNLEGPAESFVIASFEDEQSDYQGSNQSLPLTSIRRFDPQGTQTGVWLNLSGQWLRGDKKIPYGQVLHYNPSQSHLMSLLEWTSPSGQMPSWQQITGTETPELVVDRTVGLEPQFNIYQIQPQKFVPNPIQLAPISLEEPALKEMSYRDALRLARSGLWSQAAGLLRPIKTKARRNWTPQAQAQLDLIQFHAKITQAQAMASWASPGQQVLADLIDGRWSAALKVFEADLGNSAEIAAMLKQDDGRLWNRVDAAMKVNAGELDATAWGALIVGAQEGYRAASNWLDQQWGIDAQGKTRVRNLLNRLDDAISEADILEGHKSQITGSAYPVSAIDVSEWQEPEPGKGLELSDRQVWYQVQVTSFFDGKQWVKAPFTDIDISSFPTTQVKRFWKRLGLSVDPRIQIDILQANGQQKAATGTVRAFQLRDGMLRLLAAVDTQSG